MSQSIDKLVRLAKADGLILDEGDWSDVHVFWFEGLMPAEVRDAGHADPTVEYITTDDSPHNPPDEGFIDRANATAISFLLNFKEV